jgi:ABC-2 type transport system ATP-binding protein
MDHGRILALGSVQELLRQVPFEEDIQFPATTETERLCAELREGGELVTAAGWHRFRPKPEFRLSAFFLATERLGLPSRLFHIRRPSLETVFLQLTGKALRE